MLTDVNYEIVNQTPMTCFHGTGGSKLFLVHTPQEWNAFYELLMQQKRVFCDTETSGFHWFAKDRIVGMSFGWGVTHFYIPVRHLDSLTGGVQPQQLDMDAIRPQLQAFFNQEDVETVWHNFRFDAKMYYADGVEINTIVHDTLFLWHLYNENAPAALKSIASGWRDELGRWNKGLVGKDANAKEKEIDTWRGNEAKERRKEFSRIIMSMATDLQKEPKYQGVKRNDIKKIIKTDLLKDHQYAEASKDDIHYGYIPVPLMVEYAALDTFLTMKVFDHVIRNMDLSGGLGSLYKNEIELTYAILDAELEGIKVDRPYVLDLCEEYGEQIETQYKELTGLLGDINLNSSDQLSKALVAAGVLLDRTTESGKLAVDKKALAKHKKHAAVSKLLDYKKAVKLKTAFFDPLRDKMNDECRIFPSFNQNVSTGRMSCREPNMQQIPRGATVRNCFVVPSHDYIYLLADYSQIEVRLTAHYSQDPILLDAYRRGQDVHTRTSAQMFGIDYDEMFSVIKKEDKADPLFKKYKGIRDVGKVLNFGIIYGVSPWGLSEQIPRPEQYEDFSDEEWVAQCELFIDMYFHTHIGVKRFINKYARQVKDDEMIANYFGRIRHLPHANASKIIDDPFEARKLEGRAKRQGVNFLIQSSAGDLFKTAVVRVHKILKGTKSKLINFVHDEIQIYLHKDDIKLVPKLKKAMEDFNFRVPIIAEFSYSTSSWGEKKSL